MVIVRLAHILVRLSCKQEIHVGQAQPELSGEPGNRSTRLTEFAHLADSRGVQLRVSVVVAPLSLSESDLVLCVLPWGHRIEVMRVHAMPNAA